MLDRPTCLFLANQFQVTDWCLRTLNLLQYADRCAGKYSGGNKRKLSTAISLVGECPIIFLVSFNQHWQ